MKINILTVLVATVLLVSCGKKDSAEIITDPPMADQRMLATSITWAANYAYSYIMEYNTDKTLKRWVQKQFNGDIVYDIKLTYENGRVTKMFDVSRPQDASAGDVIYGTNGLPFKIRKDDRWRQYDSLDYNDKKQLIAIYSIETTNPAWTLLSYKYTWEGNNVVRMDYTLMVPNKTSTTLYSYDDKKNYSTGYEVMSSLFVLRPEYLSASNVLTSRWLDDPADDLIKYRYEYNSKGYPVKAWKSHSKAGVETPIDSARIEYLQP